MKKLAIILGALALFVVQPVAGQDWLWDDYPGVPLSGDQIRYIGNTGVHAFGYYVGPYGGELLNSSYPGSPQFTMYCVDFGTHVSTSATGWTVNAASLSTFDRAGFHTYSRAAYLASLFESSPPTSWDAIHAAIWYLTDGVVLTDGIWSYVDSGRNLVGNHATDFQGFNAAEWYLLTSVGEPQSQTFLVRYSVPEPGVIVLLLSGLLGVAFVARRRSSALS